MGTGSRRIRLLQLVQPFGDGRGLQQRTTQTGVDSDGNCPFTPPTHITVARVISIGLRCMTGSTELLMSSKPSPAPASVDRRCSALGYAGEIGALRYRSCYGQVWVSA